MAFVFVAPRACQRRSRIRHTLYRQSPVLLGLHLLVLQGIWTNRTDPLLLPELQGLRVGKWHPCMAQVMAGWWWPGWW